MTEFSDQYAPAREARVLAVDIGAHGAAALLDVLRREVGTAVVASAPE